MSERSAGGLNDPRRKGAQSSLGAVVVVNFGSSALLQRNLVPIAVSRPDLSVVVVDNFSSTAERESCRAIAERYRWALIECPNVGFGAGMNAGVNAALAAGAQTVLMLNPDASITPSAISELERTVTAQPMTLVSPEVCRPDGSIWFAGNDLYLSTGQMRGSRHRPAGLADDQVVPWLSGACLMIHRRLWSALGGFRTEYFLYWEDVDLSFRATQIGGTLSVHPRAVAVHQEGGTQTHGRTVDAKSSTYYYYNIRNRMVFAALNLSDEQVRRWRHSQRAAAKEILLRGGRRQFLRPIAPLSAAWRGMRDGARFADGAMKAGPTAG
ncbi:MAG: glycosyltransferase family 2 protein [Candidatus Nanopelagicales bacterium]